MPVLASIRNCVPNRERGVRRQVSLRDSDRPARLSAYPRRLCQHRAQAGAAAVARQQLADPEHAVTGRRIGRIGRALVPAGARMPSWIEGMSQLSGGQPGPDPVQAVCGDPDRFNSGVQRLPDELAELVIWRSHGFARACSGTLPGQRLPFPKLSRAQASVKHPSQPP